MMRLLLIALLIVVSMNNMGCFFSKKKITYKEYYHDTQGQLVKKVVFKGFLISDLKILLNIGKSYQNKYITKGDIEEIVAKVKSAYLESGFAGLVSVSHKLYRHQLTIQIDMVE